MTDKPTCSDIPWESEVGNHKKMVHYIQDTISGQVLLAVPVDLDVLAHFLSDLCYIYIEIVFPCLSDFFGLMLNVCSCSWNLRREDKHKSGLRWIYRWKDS